MNLPKLSKSFSLAVPFVLGLAACATTTKKSESLHKVDDLITRIERVQVETVVAKEKSRAALDELNILVAPDFNGDANATYAKLVAAIEQSELQGKALGQTIPPMSQTADALLERWTADLEAFGNTRMRQRSQLRLEETRERFQGVLAAAKAAKVFYDAYNADLRDYSLFLGNDFNADAVASIAPDVETLQERQRELDERLDVCATAARAYVDQAALYGQVEATPVEDTATEAPAPATTGPEQPTQPVQPGPAAKKRNAFLKPQAGAAGQAPEGATQH